MTTPRSKAPPPSTLAPMPTMHTRHKKKYLTKRKIVSTYARNTLHQKTEFLQERQI